MPPRSTNQYGGLRARARRLHGTLAFVVEGDEFHLAAGGLELEGDPARFGALLADFHLPSRLVRT